MTLSSYKIIIVAEAIQRYFESRRRLWRESVAPDQDRVAQQSKKRRIRARKERVIICTGVIVSLQSICFTPI